MSIKEFFAGKTIIVTGATGFVGQCLIEKLLRSCPQVKKIYALIRAQKNSSASERLQELLKLQIFENLESVDSEILKKVEAVSSDLSVDGLGLSEESKQILINETNVFFHCAATVRFNEQLRVAYKINTLGVMNIISLCKQMKTLEALVHVSTAYSYCDRNEIGEEVYETGWDSNQLLQSMSWMSDETIEKLLPEILRKRPNTYTLTKAFAEEMLVKEAIGLPVCIVRPSIIGATYEEPMPGWCTNLNGATGVVIGFGKGLLHTLHANQDMNLDVIPVDYVVNGIIAAAWKTAKSSNQTLVPVTDSTIDAVIKQRRKDLKVYNLVSSANNPCTLNEWHSIIIKVFTNYPLDKVYSTPSLTLVSNKYLHQMLAFLFHNVPACFFDLALILAGRKPRLFRLTRRMETSFGVLAFFLTNQWKWEIGNSIRLKEEMTCSDQKEFMFDTTSLDWKQYITVYILGTKRFLLKENSNGYPAARKHLQRLRMIGYGLQIILFIIGWRLVVSRTLIAKNAWHLFISLWYKFISFFQLSSTLHPRSFFARLLS